MDSTMPSPATISPVELREMTARFGDKVLEMGLHAYQLATAPITNAGGGFGILADELMKGRNE
jgi:hypothetical protein